MSTQSSVPRESFGSNIQIFSATRWSTNHNWCRRGDNTKYKGKK